jgi:hypothetical protein
MDNQALIGLEALCRYALWHIRVAWDWRAGCLETGPVRFGRGRLDSLRKEGLPAYLITTL